MMTSLMAAVKATLEGDCEVSSRAAGGIHISRPVTRAAMPYMVIVCRGATETEYDTAGAALERIRLDVEAFAGTAAEAGSAGRAAVAALEGSAPAVEQGECVAVAKVFETIEVEPPVGSAEPMWRAVVGLEFLTERGAH